MEENMKQIIMEEAKDYFSRGLLQLQIDVISANYPLPPNEEFFVVSTRIWVRMKGSENYTTAQMAVNLGSFQRIMSTPDASRIFHYDLALKQIEHIIMQCARKRQITYNEEILDANGDPTGESREIAHDIDFIGIGEITPGMDANKRPEVPGRLPATGKKARKKGKKK